MARVTNTQKEYIKREVSKLFPRQNLPEYDTVLSNYEAAREELYELAAAYLDQQIAHLNEKYQLSETEEYQLVRNGCCNPVPLNGYSYNAPLAIKNRAHISAEEEKRDRAVENIILQLELGGATLKELNDMIANCRKEE